jgi:hypothetical protein
MKITYGQRNNFYKDFVQPIIIPVVGVLIIFGLTYTGSKYYSKDIKKFIITKLINESEDSQAFVNKLRNTNIVKLFKNKENIHYGLIIGISSLEILNDILLLALVFLFTIGVSQLVLLTYKIQIIIMIVLLYLKTIISIAIPTVHVSLLEQLYLEYSNKNIDSVVFDQLNIVSFAMSFGLIYTLNYIKYGKSITISNWHLVTLHIILFYKLLKDMFNIKKSIENMNKPINIQTLLNLTS